MKKYKINMTIHSDDWEIQHKVMRFYDEMMKALNMIVPVGWRWEEE